MSNKRSRLQVMKASATLLASSLMPNVQLQVTGEILDVALPESEKASLLANNFKTFLKGLVPQAIRNKVKNFHRLKSEEEEETSSPKEIKSRLPNVFRRLRIKNRAGNQAEDGANPAYDMNDVTDYAKLYKQLHECEQQPSKVPDFLQTSRNHRSHERAEQKSKLSEQGPQTETRSASKINIQGEGSGNESKASTDRLKDTHYAVLLKSKVPTTQHILSGLPHKVLKPQQATVTPVTQQSSIPNRSITTRKMRAIELSPSTIPITPKTRSCGGASRRQQKRTGVQRLKHERFPQTRIEDIYQFDPMQPITTVWNYGSQFCESCNKLKALCRHAVVGKELLNDTKYVMQVLSDAM